MSTLGLEVREIHLEVPCALKSFILFSLHSVVRVLVIVLSHIEKYQKFIVLLT